MTFGKILTAMVTPFNNEGKIDYEKTEKLVEYLLENGTDGLVVAGTTGESPTLKVEEQVELFRHVVKFVNGRVPVIAGTGSNDTQHAITTTRLTNDTGVDGIMLVTPYYNKPNQRSIYAHFKAIAEVTDLPIMLYNVPGRTVVRIDPDTILQLSQLDNVVALKDATGDLDSMAEVIERTSDDFMVYCGDDSLTLPSLAIGADGIISVASHIIGNEMKEMIQLFEAGEVQKAAQLHRKLVPIMNGIFMTPSPTAVKAALNMKGIEVGSTRLPLVDLTEDELEKLSTLLNA
ncbi:4-hydroxy-tetrahydrodipicolinate synthase [Salirhabdus sp. Marseille-P4669]|uniref:4-hydroxy-tetrahydrodipicolinate synthase n=1 Tax=Salirhabdus sp. Marseille-P4669 TaxID=2042310 RepID=UPI00210080B8|nr:4-hydroxy-tetrahydrodipicolinate synthase [Salirhabdus sp. Marseille-P4669]